MFQNSSVWWLIILMACSGCELVAWGNAAVALVTVGLFCGTLSLGRDSAGKGPGPATGA
jgi:hypothetical protein